MGDISTGFDRHENNTSFVDKVQNKKNEDLPEVSTKVRLLIISNKMSSNDTVYAQDISVASHEKAAQWKKKDFTLLKLEEGDGKTTLMSKTGEISAKQLRIYTKVDGKRIVEKEIDLKNVQHVKMSDEEYNRIRSAVDNQLQSIIDNAKMNEKGDGKITNSVNKLEQTDKSHSLTAKKVTTAFMNEVKGDALPQMARNMLTQQRLAHERSQERKKEEAAEINRQAVKKDISKKRILNEETSYQEDRLQFGKPNIKPRAKRPKST